MTRTIGRGVVAAGFVYLTLTTSVAGQQFTTLLRLRASTGAHPEYGLAQGIDGYLYGTTSGAGGGYSGTIFKMSAAGVMTKLIKTGRSDATALVQDTDGNLYGGNGTGGSPPLGQIYQVTPAGGVNYIFSFNLTDGAEVLGNLIQATDGYLYGTTEGGGANSGGVVFRYIPGGGETVLYSFCSQANCSDGGDPRAGLIQATDGNFYGTTEGYGLPTSCDQSCGTVFRITPAGQLTTLYNFCSRTDCSDGANPRAGLVEASDGDLYGTTYFGGGVTSCGPYGCGTSFKVTLGGNFQKLHTFCSRTNCSDGINPQGGLIQATDGNLYGTTIAGGATSSKGTIFQITPAGRLTTLYRFCPGAASCPGNTPFATLLQATDGNLYGTTYGSFAKGEYGTIFMLSTGLGPFITMLQKSGSTGASVTILGTNLTGASSVIFHGVPASSFTVNPGGSAIFTSVPAGASSGPIEVSTPAGTLESNVPFQVTP